MWWFVTNLLQLIGLFVVGWFIFIAGEEYAKIRQREREQNEYRQ